MLRENEFPLSVQLHSRWVTCELYDASAIEDAMESWQAEEANDGKISADGFLSPTSSTDDPRSDSTCNPHDTGDAPCPSYLSQLAAVARGVRKHPAENLTIRMMPIQPSQAKPEPISHYITDTGLS